MSRGLLENSLNRFDTNTKKQYSTTNFPEETQKMNLAKYQDLLEKTLFEHKNTT
jgi:hypothetical protein